MDILEYDQRALGEKLQEETHEREKLHQLQEETRNSLAQVTERMAGQKRPLEYLEAPPEVRANSGDFAYPFYRRQGAKRFRTGEIAQLADPAGDGRAELVRDNENGTGIFVVVSDEQVLLKGGRLPKTAGEKELCHWVAKVGEVEVQVRGPVNVGDLIGPLRDGTGTGIVKPAGAQDVIGKAVAKKQDDGTGSVTLSCHFEMARGLNGDGPIHPTILCNIKAGLGPASGHISTQGSCSCCSHRPCLENCEGRCHFEWRRPPLEASRVSYDNTTAGTPAVTSTVQDALDWGFERFQGGADYAEWFELNEDERALLELEPGDVVDLTQRYSTV